MRSGRAIKSVAFLADEQVMELAIDTAPDQARLAEVDAHLRPTNQALAAAAAFAALAFLPMFGVIFTVCLALPLIWWTVRALGVDQRMGLRPWIFCLLVVVSISVAGGAAASGGADSPAVFFAGLVGLGAQTYFPGTRWTAGFGLAIVATVAAVDAIVGRDMQYFDLAAAAMLGTYLPFMVGRLVDVEQLHRRRAVIDPLTGCLNRRSLETRIEELEAHADRTDGPISIVSFDLDHFKAVNDVHGHAAGDEILEHVAYVVRKQLRRFELFYRLGGEEFAILLPDTDLESAAALAERLRAAIAAETVGVITVTASFGVSSATPPLSVEALLADADEALYDAKRSGRNRVVSDLATTAVV